MKLRLLEYLICPEHPDEYLQLRKGHVAKLFDYAREVRAPLCRAYCGLAQGRFDEIHPDFVPDCQYCMSLEVEWGILSCPVCGGFYALFEGIPVLTDFFPAGTDLAADRLAAEFHFGTSKLTEYKRRGPFAGWANQHEANVIADHIEMEPVNTVLYLGGASPAVISLFIERGIETVIASEDPHELSRISEKELVTPSKPVFTAVSGPDPTGLRKDSFDLVISGYRLYGPTGFERPAIGDLFRTSTKSGYVVLTLYRDNIFKRVFHLCEGKCGSMNETAHMIDELLSGQPGMPEEMIVERHRSSLLEVVMLRAKATPPEDIRTPLPGDAAEAMINA